MGVDPLQGLAQIANDPATPQDLRAKIYADLLPYLFPKKRPLDVPSSNQPSFQINIGIDGGVKPICSPQEAIEALECRPA